MVGYSYVDVAQPNTKYYQPGSAQHPSQTQQLAPPVPYQALQMVQVPPHLTQQQSHHPTQSGEVKYDDVYEYMTDQSGRQFLVKSSAVVRDVQMLRKCTTNPVVNQIHAHSVQPSLGTKMVGYPQGDQIPTQQSLTDHISQSYQDRNQGMSIFNDQRATKKPTFGDFLKRCPVRWARDTNTRNMNLCIFGYASLAELEYGVMTCPDQITNGELLAKIGHLKSVFEVCCLNSKDSEFKGYGWVLARDYAAKVSNKMEQGFTTWEGLPSGVQTAELVSAKCDYPRPPQKSDKEKDKETETRKKKLCTTYNTCSTEYKCEYEVANPEKECQRLHECSWCRKNLKQGFKHQENRCKKKTE